MPTLTLEGVAAEVDKVKTFVGYKEPVVNPPKPPEALDPSKNAPSGKAWFILATEHSNPMFNLAKPEMIWIGGSEDGIHQWVGKMFNAGQHSIELSELIRIFGRDPYKGVAKQAVALRDVIADPIKPDPIVVPNPTPPTGALNTFTYAEAQGFVPSYGIGFGETIHVNDVQSADW
ncbi:MAG: hypothetical protein ACRDBG_27680, partial [Waterburya sp.]